jgi:hypothetical protein
MNTHLQHLGEGFRRYASFDDTSVTSIIFGWNNHLAKIITLDL